MVDDDLIIGRSQLECMMATLKRTGARHVIAPLLGSARQLTDSQGRVAYTIPATQFYTAMATGKRRMHFEMLLPRFLIATSTLRELASLIESHPLLAEIVDQHDAR